MVFNLFLFAIVIEGITTYFKEWFVKDNFNFWQLFTVLLGIVVAISYDLDLLALFGAESNFVALGNVLTGVLLSRGSNYMFDLWQVIDSKKLEHEKA